jgi:hypothetical protein
MISAETLPKTMRIGGKEVKTSLHYSIKDGFYLIFEDMACKKKKKK